MARYVNSKSRIVGGTTEDYIRNHWNGFRHGSGLESFFGVNRAGERDDDGFEIYELTAEAKRPSANLTVPPEPDSPGGGDPALG